MSTALTEQICVLVEAKLKTITLANGYSADVRGVQRPRRSGLNALPAHREILLLLGDDRLSPGPGGNPPAASHAMRLNVEYGLAPPENATDAIDTLINAAAADVARALMADPQWGGLAIDTRIEAVQPYDGSAGVEGVSIVATISLRTAENDWTVQA